MRQARPVAPLLAAFAVVLLLSACGKSSLSVAELRSRATSICARANHQLEAVVAPHADAGAKRFLETGAATLSKELEELRGLSSSGEAGVVYKAAVSSVGAELAAIRGAAHTLGAGADVVPALRALSERLTPLEVQANHAWQALQISACLTR